MKRWLPFLVWLLTTLRGWRKSWRHGIAPSLVLLALSTWMGHGLVPSASCGEQSGQTMDQIGASNQVFNLEAHAIPKFVEADYIDLSKIGSISKFRSGEGHDYSDDFESCRSMKHYFKPRADIDWSTMKIFSPVTGVIVQTEEEWAGTKLDIQVAKYPAFVVSIFHVNLISALRPGDKVTAGQVLGSHIGKQTCSDIAVCIHTPKGRKLVSYFEVMPARLFQQYRSRGLASPDAAVISKEMRDADPLGCQGGKFTSRSHVQDWIFLRDTH